MIVIVVASALLAGAASAVADVAVRTPQPPGQISATLSSCHQAAASADRYATFDAQMTAVPGSEALSIRFELDERAVGSSRFRAVRGVPGFGMWTQSLAGVDIFGYSHEVSALSAPAAFRVTVSYHWLGARHRVIRRARRVTPACVVLVAPAIPQPAPTAISAASPR